MWKRRSEVAREETRQPRTTEIVTELLGTDGTLVDIGAGRGRASLSVAAAGHQLVAVEKDPGMAQGLRDDAAAMGVDVTIVEDRWPDAEDQVPPSDVVMSAHVVYDVPDIGVFVAAMDRIARCGVVIELSPEHPWAPLSPYFRAIHGLDRPVGPTAEDLTAVVEAEVGTRPTLERWTRRGQMWFADWDEILSFYGRRLVVPEHRREQLRSVLEPDVTEIDRRLYLGTPERSLGTIWWKKAA